LTTPGRGLLARLSWLAMTSLPVFISYSRKDYYFAESLAFHLMQRGIPAWLDVKDLKPGVDWERDLEAALDAAQCLILVASRDSLRSTNVGGEWRRAQSSGRRIIVARFGGVRLPAKLEGCELIDFRGAFLPALDKLANLVEAATPVAAAKERSRASGLSVVLPPWIVAVAFALALPSLAMVSTAEWGDDSTAHNAGMSYSVLLTGAVLLTAGLIWYFCVTFLRRRMGMTRLALSLVVLTFLFGYPLAKYWMMGPSSVQGYSAGMVRFVSDHWLQTVLLCMAPLLALGVVLFQRPEDLLRWTPTGKAWKSYRVGHAANAVFAAADIPSQLKQVKSFYLVHDDLDTPAAERLRQELLKAGATEATADATDATAVLLLTNRTRTEWLNQQQHRLQGSLLTVVGSGIGLPESLAWLWRRQWIDFRRWDARGVDREKGLPQVPEALTRLRVPLPIGRVHHVLCATGALMFVAAGAIMPQTTPHSETLTLNEAMGMLSFFSSIAWAVPARRLLRRSTGAAQFWRYVLIVSVASIALGAWDMYDFAAAKQAYVRIIPAALFLFAAPQWLLRQRRELDFWFPQDLKQDKQANSLAPGRNWRTLGWFALYALIWTSLLDPGT
jgi:hypothetical protein